MFKNRKKLNQIMYILAIVMVTGMILMAIAPAVIGN